MSSSSNNTTNSTVQCNNLHFEAVSYTNDDSNNDFEEAEDQEENQQDTEYDKYIGEDYDHINDYFEDFN